MTPEETTALVQSLQDNAQRLGLTWNLTFATVVSINPIGLQFDGDDASVANSEITNLTGAALWDGARVAVITVPPAGVYIIGFATEFGLKRRAESSTLNVGNNTLEFTIFTLTNVIVPPLSVLRGRYRISTETSGGANNVAQIAVHAGTLGTTADPVVYTGRHENINGFGQITRYDEFYMRNATSQPLTRTLLLTGIAQISIHVQVLASVTNVLYFEAESVPVDPALYALAPAL